MLVIGLTGSRQPTSLAKHDALGIAKKYGGIDAGRLMGKQGAKSRFRAPYLRNTLCEAGYAIDTPETATTWNKVDAMMAEIGRALRHELDDIGEEGYAFAHLSHVCPTGSSIHATYVFRIARDAHETLRRWTRLKEAASRAIVGQGGTISHQHGVGVDHMPYLAAEKGELGMGAIRQAMAYWDPNGIMNPGRLV
jgi:alkyldihydroxyacetonephosphate synthase